VALTQHAVGPISAGMTSTAPLPMYRRRSRSAAGDRV
jgi:hypothetical protein